MGITSMKKADVAENETKHDRFLRLARKRMNKILKDLRQLGNLGDGNYEFTEQEKIAVLTKLFDGAHDVKRRFERKEKDAGFSF